MPIKAKPLRKVHTTVLRADEHARPQIKQTPNFIRKVTITTPKPTYLSRNRKGLISFNNWDGKLWDTKWLDFFRQQPEYSSMQSSRYFLTQIRSQENRPLREVDRFLVAHAHANVAALRRSLPFRVHVADSTVLNFLLKTSPRRIYRQLHDDIGRLTAVTYGLDKDVRDFGVLQADIAMLPHNPLYVISRAQKARWLATVRTQQTVVKKAQRDYRFAHKASQDLDSETRTENLSKLAEEHVGRIPQTPYPEVFFCRPCTWAIEPFISGLNRIMAHQRGLIVLVEHMLASKKMTPLMESRWRDTAWTCHLLRNLERMTTYTLARDLAALVYFRAWRYSISDAEIMLGKALYVQLSRKFGATSFPSPQERIEPVYRTVRIS